MGDRVVFRVVWGVRVDAEVGEVGMPYCGTHVNWQWLSWGVGPWVPVERHEVGEGADVRAEAEPFHVFLVGGLVNVKVLDMRSEEGRRFVG